MLDTALVVHVEEAVVVAGAAIVVLEVSFVVLEDAVVVLWAAVVVAVCAPGVVAVEERAAGCFCAAGGRRMTRAAPASTCRVAAIAATAAKGAAKTAGHGHISIAIAG